MPARTRTREFGGLVGSLKTSSQAIPSNTTYQRNRGSIHLESCSDVTGNRTGDNPFRLNRKTISVKAMSGKNSFVECIGDPVPSAFTGLGFGAHINFQLSTSVLDSGAATRAMAASNPSRPVVNLPVAIFEFKDIPKLVKQAGDAIRWARKMGRGTPPTARGLAEANLAYNFGIKPLIDDTLKLFKFQEAVDKRRLELEKLKQGGLRRSIIVETKEMKSSASNYNIEGGNYINIAASAEISEELKSWVSLRWQPTALPSYGNNSPTDWDIQKLVLGLNFSFATVWEALPWSWLIDWFTNTGDFLAAYRNTVPARATRLCRMTQKTRTIVYTPSSVTTGFQWGGATVKHVDLDRHIIATPSFPTPQLPFLGPGQLSILGSLALLRRSRSRA